MVLEPRDETEQTIAARVHVFARALEATRTLDHREVPRGLEQHARQPAAGTTLDTRSPLAEILEPSLGTVRAHAQVPIVIATLVDAACAHGSLSDYATARRILDEANSLSAAASVFDDSPARAAAKIAYWAGEWGSAVELLADTILPDDRSARLESLLILAVAVVTVDGKPALLRALDYLARAEAILDLGSENDDPAWVGNPVARGRCLRARFLCYHFADERWANLRLRLAEEGIAVARVAGLRWDESAQLHNAAEQYLLLGDTKRARAKIAESNAIAPDLGAGRLSNNNDVLLAYLDRDRATRSTRGRSLWRAEHGNLRSLLVGTASEDNRR